jgi:hypothetical protein
MQVQKQKLSRKDAKAQRHRKEKLCVSAALRALLFFGYGFSTLS